MPQRHEPVRVLVSLNSHFDKMRANASLLGREPRARHVAAMATGVATSPHRSQCRRRAAAVCCAAADRAATPCPPLQVPCKCCLTLSPGGLFYVCSRRRCRPWPCRRRLIAPRRVEDRPHRGHPVWRVLSCWRVCGAGVTTERKRTSAPHLILRCCECRAPPEGVLDDLMNNVDPSDPYGGPVWGMQSGDIGSTYEYGAQPVMLAGQAQMPESWVQDQQGRPVVMQPNSGNFQYIPNPRARAMRMRLAGQPQMPESWTTQTPNGQANRLNSQQMACSLEWDSSRP